MRYRIKTTKDKVEEGKDLVRKNGGSFHTDDSFEISGVKGFVEFSDNTVIIDIKDKPFLASWSMIEEKLIKFFG